MFKPCKVGAALVAALALVVPAGCGVSQIPGPAPVPSAPSPDRSEPSVKCQPHDEEKFDCASEVLDNLPAALEGFDGTFPDADRSIVLARVTGRFKAEMRAHERDEGPNEPAVFAHGYAESVVATEWLCSWEGAYLASLKSRDAAGVARADEQLATWYDLAYTKAHVQDPEKAWATEVLDPARRGDTRPMAADYKMCNDGLS